MRLNITAGQMRAIEGLSREIPSYSIRDDAEVEINIDPNADRSTEVSKVAICFGNAPAFEDEQGFFEGLNEGYALGYEHCEEDIKDDEQRAFDDGFEEGYRQALSDYEREREMSEWIDRDQYLKDWDDDFGSANYSLEKMAAVSGSGNDPLLNSLDDMEPKMDFSDHYDECEGCALCEDYWASPF